jgi:hypothetical protein
MELSYALRSMAEVGLSARTRRGGTARTLAGSVRSNAIHYTRFLLFRFPRDRFELVDAAVGHEREEQVAVLDDVRSNVAPLLHDLIVQRARRALRSCQRERTELELARAARFPSAASSIPVDARGQPAAGTEFDGVLRAIIGSSPRVVTALELDELPRRPFEPGRLGAVRTPDCLQQTSRAAPRPHLTIPGDLQQRSIASRMPAR